MAFIANPAPPIPPPLNEGANKEESINTNPNSNHKSKQEEPNPQPKLKEKEKEEKQLTTENNVKIEKIGKIEKSKKVERKEAQVKQEIRLNEKQEKGEKQEKQRAKPRKWTEEEENLFLQGLEIYGRNWKTVAEHIKTRDSKAVKSHAQKYFIKLYKENKPLPKKVRETGDGYTLSGKPLNPHSATARAYGVLGAEGIKQYRNEKLMRKLDLPYFLQTNILSPGTIVINTNTPDKQTKEAKLLDSGRIMFESKEHSLVEFEKTLADELNICIWDHCSLNGVTFSKLAEDCCHKDPRKGVGKSGRVRSRRRSSTTSVASEAAALKKKQRLIAKQERQQIQLQKRQEKQRKIKEKKAEKERKAAQERAKWYDSDGMTEYTRNRSRRRVRKDLGLAGKINGEETSHPQFVDVTQYKKEEQPFTLVVNTSVYVVAATHAHLSLNEVIGFLAGTWEPENNKLTVTTAFPGRSSLEETTECELDPESAVELRDTIETEKLSVVGWYHSHPTFEPTPSNWDVTNQKNYQTIFRDHKYGKEPFVGLIWCPYDYTVNGMNDAYKWFYIDPPSYLEKAMFITPENELNIENKLRGMKFLKEFLESRYESLANPIVFEEIYQEVKEENEKEVKVVSYGNKLKSSLSTLLPDEVEAFEKLDNSSEFEIIEFIQFLIGKEENPPVVESQNGAVEKQEIKNEET